MEILTRAEKQNKSNRITVRLSQNQYEQILDKASKAGLGAATYLRICGMQQQIKARLSDEELQYYKQLASMSNSLNQLAKAANTNGILMVLKEILATINEMNFIIENLRK